MTNIRSSSKCNYCGSNLELTHTGPCPNCGKIGSKAEIEITLDPLNITTSGEGESKTEYREYNIPYLLLLVLLTVISAIFGYYLGENLGIYSIFLSLVFALITSVIGYLAITKVIDREKFKF